ncbi:adenylosuccinate synthase [Mycobacterium sp. TY815]|uniref:adenylosuccinate synthase n=1 Tax=Mycobacterium sp. TY815 TaxID=3050581 RepID=UPI002740796D|nr:adenylosuccinate synthase [Mycobacterium sp. TY815]MDP7706800.1 adenylosuccinate synthase [Mycobacterium sp. TY815]
MTAAKSDVSRIPANARKPQDRKPKKTPAEKAAVKQLQAEAEDGYVTVEQCGVQLRIPVAGKIPLAAVIAFEQDENLRGTELLLGKEQWSAFLAANPTLDDFIAIGEKLEAITGNL